MAIIKIDLLKITMTLILLFVGYEFIESKNNKQNHSPIGRMIDVGGYKLHAIDKGQGKPVVVIDPGMGCEASSLGLIYPEIAKFTRVIVVDRAGYAWSDTSPLLRTSENIVKELHTMLHNANVPSPYILVGHSFGGANVRLFASKYPDEVAGIILVDASHEDQFKDGILDKFYQKSMLNKSRTKSKKYHNGTVVDDESLNFKLSLKQLKDHGRLLDNIPLIVIIAGKKPTVKDFQGYLTQDEIDNHQDVFWHDLQMNLAKKSSRGKFIVAQKSGHMIPNEQPEIIVEAVREMVAELRNAKE